MSGCSRVSAFQSHNLLARMAYHHHRKASIQLDPLQRSHQHLQPPSHHSNRLHIRNKAQSFLSSLQCLQKEIDINCKENATIHCTELIIQKNYKVVNAIKKNEEYKYQVPLCLDGWVCHVWCMHDSKTWKKWLGWESYWVGLIWTLGKVLTETILCNKPKFGWLYVNIYRT